MQKACRAASSAQLVQMVRYDQPQTVQRERRSCCGTERSQSVGCTDPLVLEPMGWGPKAWLLCGPLADDSECSCERQETVAGGTAE